MDGEERKCGCGHDCHCYQPQCEDCDCKECKCKEEE